MKKYLLILVCLTTTLLYTSAQESIFPDQLFTNLRHVAVDGNTIFAIGTCAGAQISTDGGLTWDIFQIEDDAFMRDLKIKPNSNGTEAYVINYQDLYILNIDHTLTEVNTASLNAFGSMRGMQIDEEYIYT